MIVYANTPVLCQTLIDSVDSMHNIIVAEQT